MPSAVEVEIIERLTRIEEKVDNLSTHEDRISALERWRSWTTGIAVGVLMLAGAIWKVVKG